MDDIKMRALYKEYQEINGFMQEHEQISFVYYLDDTYKKKLLLASASYFEAVITNAIHDFTSTKSKQCVEIVSFVDNKAVSRQYHTFFDWNSKNVNRFLMLFGEDFKNRVREQIKERELEENEVAFMDIGNERNKLVHQNFIEAQINSTFEEIYNKHVNAYKFVELIVEMLEA